MAFCTACGATLSGAYCSKCGTPAASAASSAAAPQAVPPGAMPPPSAAVRRTHPIVWVLVALAGVFALFIIGIAGVSALVVHKARQAGVDADLMRHNPAAAVARMAALANKSVEIVGEDDSAGTITLRDRHTGKTVVLSFDQVRNGIRFSADDDNGKTAEMEIGGGGTVKLPLWVPAYPGSEARANFSVRGSDGNTSGQGGNCTFTTPDSPSDVMSFYETKARDRSMSVKVTARTSEGGVIVATDEPGDRSLTVVVGRDGGSTTVNLTYGDKR